MLNKVSIIIPLYNKEENLSLLLERVCNQTYKNIEVILIDDGSKDNTYKICEKYKKSDDRICLYKQTNRGVSAARNVGLDIATGTYIAFIDGDDYIEKNYIEKLIEKISGKERNAVSVSKILVRDEKNNIISEIDPEVNKYDTTIEYFLNHWNVWGVLFPKKIIDAVRFDETIKISEDYKFISQLVANNDIMLYSAEDAIYNYVIHEQSAMQSRYSSEFLKGLHAEVEAYENLLKKGKKFYSSRLIGNAAYQCMRRYFHENSEIRNKYYKDYEEAKKIIRRYFNVIILNNTIEKSKKILIITSCIFPWLIVVKNYLKVNIKWKR